MGHTYPAVSEVWPVIGGDGETRLFATQEAAETYVEDHGGTTAPPMPVMGVKTVWYRAWLEFTGMERNGMFGSYKVSEHIDTKERAVTDRHPSCRWFGFDLEVCARTPGHARVMADYIGRLTVGPKGLGHRYGWGLTRRLTGAPLDYISEDGTLLPGAPKWMALDDTAREA